MKSSRLPSAVTKADFTQNYNSSYVFVEERVTIVLIIVTNKFLVESHRTEKIAFEIKAQFFKDLVV